MLNTNKIIINTHLKVINDDEPYRWLLELQVQDDCIRPSLTAVFLLRRVLGRHCQRLLLEDQTLGSIPRLQLWRNEGRDLRQVHGGRLHQHLLQPAGPQRPRQEAGRQSSLLLVSSHRNSCPLHAHARTHSHARTALLPLLLCHWVGLLTFFWMF